VPHNSTYSFADPRVTSELGHGGALAVLLQTNRCSRTPLTTFPLSSSPRACTWCHLREIILPCISSLFNMCLQVLHFVQICVHARSRTACALICLQADYHRFELTRRAACRRRWHWHPTARRRSPGAPRTLPVCASNHQAFAHLPPGITPWQGASALPCFSADSSSVQGR
jgi:hypothetical protein